MLVHGSLPGPGPGPHLEKHEGPGRERMCERAAGPALLTVAPCLRCWGRGGGWGWGGHRPPRVTQEAAPREKLARTGQRPALLPSARSGVPSAKGADRLRGAGARRACATPADAALKQLAVRWLRRRSNEEVKGSQGRKHHRERTPRPAGGRGAAVHGGWPGRPPEWAPCPEGLGKEGTHRTYCFRGSFRPVSGE